MDEIGTPCADYIPPLHPVKDLIAVPLGMKVVSNPQPRGNILSGTFKYFAEGGGDFPVYIKQLSGIGQLVALSAANYGSQGLAAQPWVCGPILFEHFAGGQPVCGFPDGADWPGGYHYIGGHHKPERYQWAVLAYSPTLFPGHTFSVTFRGVQQGDELKVCWVLVVLPAQQPTAPGPRKRILRPRFRGPTPIQ